MVDDYERRNPDLLPPPSLLRAEVPNLGPVIDPPFVDVPDFREYLIAPDIRPVDFEELEPRIGAEARERATAAALAADAVSQRLSDKRHEVLAVGTKSLDRETEHLLVVIYNYDDDVVVEVAVDPAGGAVLDVVEGTHQPSLAPVEHSRALELASQHGPLVEAGVDFATGVGLIVEHVDFRSPYYRHRLVDLRFGPAERYLPTAFAIVDLSEQAVIRAGLLVPQEAAS